MTGDRRKTAVVSAGYVGTARAVGLAEQGGKLVLVDRDCLRSIGYVVELLGLCAAATRLRRWSISDTPVRRQ